jgi:hypothetical protein
VKEGVPCTRKLTEERFNRIQKVLEEIRCIEEVEEHFFRALHRLYVTELRIPTNKRENVWIADSAGRHYFSSCLV